MFRWLGKMNLMKKLIVFFVLLIVMPILVAYAIVSHRVASITEGQMGDTLYQLAKTGHLMLDRDIISVDGTMEKLMIASETQRLFELSLTDEYERLQTYLQLDKLLGNYSKGALDASVFYPSAADGYPFAPESDVKANGVFFVCDTTASSWFADAVRARGAGILRVIDRFGNNPGHVRTTAYLRGMGIYTDAYAPAGVLVMTGLDVLLRRDLESLKIPADGRIVLLNRANEVLATTDAYAVGSIFKLPDDVSGLDDGVYIDRSEKPSSLYAIHTSEDSQTKLMFKIPVSSIIGEHEAMRELVNYLMILYFAILLVASLSFFRHILSPLSRLARLTRSYEPGRPLGGEDRSERQDEIGLLNRSFVDMTKRLNQTIHDKYDLELKHKEAELTLLHSQINPHLLYNTLESIFWRTTKEGNSESAEMIHDLSLLMRIGLSRGKTLIPIEEELNHAEAYLRLQLKRSRYAFGVIWDVEEETRSCLIPKVVLQPLLENAIVHGIRKMEGEGELRITIKRDGASIAIAIEDNGYRPADLARIDDILSGRLPHEGYGIHNVNRRIRFHFGEEYGLSFAAGRADGTVAMIRLPARVEDNGDMD